MLIPEICMLEKEIIQLLQKISKQLEDISAVQNEIKRETGTLYQHLLELEEVTIHNLEMLLGKQPEGVMLN